jgi:hypothetical protein
MLKDEPLPGLKGWSYRLRWLASVFAAVITAAWVFNTTAGAAQRLAWLMERARPACMHNGMSNEELHTVAEYELGVARSRHDALRAVISVCEARFGSPRKTHAGEHRSG